MPGTLQGTAQYCHPLAAADVGHGSLVQLHPLDLSRGPIRLAESTLTVGRSSRCDVQIDDPSVSRRHAEFCFRDGYPEVADAGSTNGVRVNEMSVTRATLRSGDRIQLGSYVFRYLSEADLEARYHATVYSMMTRDGLTEAYNKRYLLESLRRETARCRRHARPIAVILLDIDRFKTINDTHGHLVGDDVLRVVAARLRGVLREDEMLARFGGEEFVVVMVETRADEAAAVAERCRGTIAETPVQTSAGTLSVTISLGVVAPPAGSTATVEELLAAADANLYAAKAAGRNRVIGPTG